MFQRAIGASGGGSASAPELIWTNQSPNAAMSATTINSSTSGWVSGKSVDDYDGFIVFSKYYSGAGYGSQGYSFNYIPNYDVSSMASEGGGYYGHFIAPSKQTDARYVPGTPGARIIKIENGGFTIGDAAIGTTYCIPVYIWGVKGQLTAS